MINELDINYYSYLIEMELEHRKFRERLFASTSLNMLRESNNAEFVEPVYEGVLKSIFDFIANIFQKVIDFFKNILNFLTGKKGNNTDYSFTVDQDLLTRCEQKMKDFSLEDRKTFKLEKIDAYEILKTNVPSIETLLKNHRNVLDDTMNKFEKLSKADVGLELFKHDTLETIEKDSKKIDELRNIDNIEDSFKDITFNEISKVMSNYKSGEKIIADLKVEVENSIKDMEGYKKKVEKSNLEKRAITENSEKVIKDVKNYILAATSLITKGSKAKMDLNLIAFGSQGKILRKFVAFKSEKEDKQGGDK